MFANEIRAAVMASPRAGLPALSAALWKAYDAKAIDDVEAQQLAELIEARKVVPVVPPAPRRVGSRPRTPASLERRRRWAASGWLPPVLACSFTLAELAALSVIARQVSERGDCKLTLGAIAGLAGCCKTTVRSALHRAKGLGLVTVEEWRLSAWRSAPNTVRIISREWTSWLALSARRGVGTKQRTPLSTNHNQEGAKALNRKSGKRAGGYRGGSFIKKQHQIHQTSILK